MIKKEKHTVFGIDPVIIILNAPIIKKIKIMKMKEEVVRKDFVKCLLILRH
jgi:hypothetical protein